MASRVVGWHSILKLKDKNRVNSLEIILSNPFFEDDLQNDSQNANNCSLLTAEAKF